jgi:hypothetical protein
MGTAKKSSTNKRGHAAYGSGGPEKERDAATRIWVEVPMRDLLRDLPCFGHRYNAPKQRGLGETGKMSPSPFASRPTSLPHLGLASI